MTSHDHEHQPEADQSRNPADSTWDEATSAWAEPTSAARGVPDQQPDSLAQQPDPAMADPGHDPLAGRHGSPSSAEAPQPGSTAEPRLADDRGQTAELASTHAVQTADTPVVSPGETTSAPPADTTGPADAAAADSLARPAAEPSSEASLFADHDLAALRTRWYEVQAGFVDDPRDCVQQADGLVSDVVGQLAAGFTEARSHLEEQWGRGEEASTEDLRVALRRYRDFFERLLAV